ncbi:LysE family translocator [Maridesulfovibrio sp. FT414]|uniref:LysE family translocator n=1 Tax=Maridesulfovibrio sp. FT414 TaxID=2979469 RepID=UPI003D805972
MSFIYESNLILAGAVTILAVISPGPDFAVIVRNGLMFGRRTGLMTAAGIACGVTVHVTYSLLGLGYLVSEFSWFLGVVRWVGAGYLIWLGISAFISGKADGAEGSKSLSCSRPVHGKAFVNGFLCNALNPKTMLFFMALFTQVVSPETPKVVLAGLGIFISAVHFIWFSFVVLVLTDSRFSTFFVRFKSHLEKLVGGCLLGLGVKLAVDG